MLHIKTKFILITIMILVKNINYQSIYVLIDTDIHSFP